MFVYGGELNAVILADRERQRAEEEAARHAAAEAAALARAPLVQKFMRRLGYEKRKR
jgi:hypothetical protein